MLTTAKQLLLEAPGITEKCLQEAFDKMLLPGVDSADMYFQHEVCESWSIEDSIIKSGSFHIDQGVGLRVITGEKTGFAYSDELCPEALLYTATAASAIADRSDITRAQAWQKLKAPDIAISHDLYANSNPLLSLDDAAKITLLQMVDQEARKQDPRVTQVMASLAGCYEVVLIITNEGEVVADIRPLTRLNVSVVVQHDGKYERGAAGGGGRLGYEHFYQNDLALHYARDAVRIALVNLDAVTIDAGMMPVVLGNGWPAVLLHEAIGHGLEGDFIRKGSSVYADKMSTKVASSLCTIVDEGNLAGNRRGSLYIDDEGTATQQTVLIENGILCGFMYDKLNAKLMHTKTTGNGRRESYAHCPMPRMTNTYMLPGNSDPAEIVASVDKGLYAVNFSGGQVDITSGEFVFSTSEAYLIENGKITAPVKGATLIGNGPQVLPKICMVGNDLVLDPGVGSCGKDGQSVPVGVGQPTLKITELTVGGAKKS